MGQDPQHRNHHPHGNRHHIRHGELHVRNSEKVSLGERKGRKVFLLLTLALERSQATLRQESAEA